MVLILRILELDFSIQGICVFGSCEFLVLNVLLAFGGLVWWFFLRFLMLGIGFRGFQNRGFGTMTVWLQFSSKFSLIQEFDYLEVETLIIRSNLKALCEVKWVVILSVFIIYWNILNKILVVKKYVTILERQVVLINW